MPSTSRLPRLASPREITSRSTRDARRDNAAILELGQHSAAEPLWRGDFVACPTRAPGRVRPMPGPTSYKGEWWTTRPPGLDLASSRPPGAPRNAACRAHGLSRHLRRERHDRHGPGAQTIFSHLCRSLWRRATPSRGLIIAAPAPRPGRRHHRLRRLRFRVPVNPSNGGSGWIRNNVTDRVGLGQ
jgi:hypothetical protein